MIFGFIFFIVYYILNNYTKYHKMHHENIETCWWDAYHGSIIENTISPLGIFIPMIYFNVFDIECILSMIVTNIRGCVRHESRLKHIFGNHHLIHHNHFNYNYGEIWIDYLMGTNYKQ